MIHMQMIRSYLYIMLSIVCFLAATTRASAQTLCDNWSIQTQIDSATCKANGRIAITITGADKPNLGSFLYSLTPVGGGNTKIVQSATAVLETIEPGTYELTVEAVCGGAAVSKTLQVRVPGKYKNVALYLTPSLKTYGNCAFGGVECKLAGGSPPFTISIDDAPTTYTGARSFIAADSVYKILNLNAGRYKIAVEDACNTRQIDSVLVVKDALLPIDQSNNIIVDKSNCRFNVVTTVSFYDRRDLSAHYTYALSYNKGAIGPFKNLSNQLDTIILPLGTTLNDVDGKYIGLYLKSDCGDTIYQERPIIGPFATTSSNLNCSGTYEVNYEVYNFYNVCPPLLGILKSNINNNIVYYDTLNGPTKSSGFFSNVVEGSYTMTLTDRGGYKMTYPVTVHKPNIGYSISLLASNGYYGNDGAISFVLRRNSGAWMKNTKVQLISPSNLSFYYDMKNDPYVSGFVVDMTSGPSPQYFFPGSYLFRVSDSCGTYDLPVVVTEKDVYRYNWSYSSEQMCSGGKITPTGTKTYEGKTDNYLYYKIVDGPTAVGTVVSNGGSFLLSKPGIYTIATGANNYVIDYKVNSKKVTYYSPTDLNLDRSQTLGWVCPGAAQNTGTIRTLAIGGRSGSRQYTYKLAMQGNGPNGPYLDSNTTGYFTSNARYSLVKNTSYSIKVIDDCETSIVQDVQILDFATYQIITTDKPMFCVGDTVYLKAINLPTTAKNYYWEFPNSSTISEGQSQVIYNVDSTKAGKYKVTINSDLCGQPIKGEVNIKVAPYTIRCYSAVTDTSVNPYIHGLLGNWRPYRSYAYYGARAQTDPAVKTDIRKDGAYNDFMVFWEKQTASWTPRQDTTRWVWNAESSVFSRKGFELENKDPLGRYNAGLYGYDGAVPVAVVQNSRYRESGFDGFEDYHFTAGNCDDGLCPVGRHFDFSRYKNKLSNEQSHTGRYSLKAAQGDSIMLSALVTDSDRLLTAPEFQQAVKCNTTVLKAVRLNTGVLVPEFSPVAGKRFLFSVWVKEEQDCKCTAYTSSEITLLVGGPVRVTATAQPKGAIIDGWQQYEGVIDVPKGATAFNVVIVPRNNVNVYYDDLRIHPYNANMKSFVYDPVNLRLMAELDENNYATLYEYDDDGTLTRVKKETERGVKTIKETRSALLKETAQ